MNKEQRAFVEKLLEDWEEVVTGVGDESWHYEYPKDIAARRAEFERLFPKESE